MTKHSTGRHRLLYSQITSTVSVSLVLLMLGVISLLGIGARKVAGQMEEQVGFTVVMTDSASARNINSMGTILKRAPYTAEATYISAAEVLDRWNSLLGEGDSVAGSNPFLPEWEVKVKHGYSSPDSLIAIASRLRSYPDVADVSCRTDVADAINSTVNMLTITFVAIAAVLLIISFFLISNTIRLAVYSHRHTIHAMRLVGATGGFIRRPFVGTAVMCGLIAAAAATAVLAAAVLYISTIFPPLLQLDALEYGCVAGGMFVIGIAICAIAAVVATNRYLRMDYDEL